MSDVPQDVRKELQKAVAFTAVIDLWTSLDGFTEETAAEFLQPHQATIEDILNKHPSLDPVVEENPVELIEDDLEASGMLDVPVINDHVETTRKFYEEKSVLPIELEVSSEDGDRNNRL